MVYPSVLYDQAHCRGCCHNGHKREEEDVGPVPCLLLSPGRLPSDLMTRIASTSRISWGSESKNNGGGIRSCLTLMKTMLGNTKVSGKSVKDPNRFTKSPMKGNKAVTKVFSPKTSARSANRRRRLALENIPSSSFWNLVSSAS